MKEHVSCVCTDNESQSSRQAVLNSLLEAESACSSAGEHSPLLLLIHQASQAMVDWAVVAAPFLLPISFIWDTFCFSRLWITYWLAKPDKQHSTKVFAVQAQVTICIFHPRLLV